MIKGNFERLEKELKKAGFLEPPRSIIGKPVAVDSPKTGIRVSAVSHIGWRENQGLTITLSDGFKIKFQGNEWKRVHADEQVIVYTEI